MLPPSTAASEPRPRTVRQSALGPCERERQRQLRRRHAFAHHQSGLRRADEQHPAGRKQTVEYPHRRMLRLPVKVDQHVAAENEIEGFQRLGIECQQIRLAKPHTLRHHWQKPPLLTNRRKKTLAKAERAVAERVAAVMRTTRDLERAAAYVDCIDGKTLRRNARFE